MIFASVKSFVLGNLLKLAGVGLAAALLFAGVQTVRIEGAFCNDSPDRPKCVVNGFKQEVTALRFSLNQETVRADLAEAKHAATKRAYVEAQEEAARVQADVIAREVARQERITDEVRKGYQQRVADLRARADRLRAQLRAREGGNTAGPSDPVRVPLFGDTPGGIDGTPDCEAFPAPTLDTDLRCREIAEKQATQLEALIDWVSRQVNAPE